MQLEVPNGHLVDGKIVPDCPTPPNLLDGSMSIEVKHLKQLEEEIKLKDALAKATTMQLEAESKKAEKLAAKAARDETKAANEEEKKLALAANKEAVSETKTAEKAKPGGASAKKVAVKATKGKEKELRRNKVLHLLRRRKKARRRQS